MVVGGRGREEHGRANAVRSIGTPATSGGFPVYRRVLLLPAPPHPRSLPSFILRIAHSLSLSISNTRSASFTVARFLLFRSSSLVLLFSLRRFFRSIFVSFVELLQVQAVLWRTTDISRSSCSNSRFAFLFQCLLPNPLDIIPSPHNFHLYRSHFLGSTEKPRLPLSFPSRFSSRSRVCVHACARSTEES